MQSRQQHMQLGIYYQSTTISPSQAGQRKNISPHVLPRLLPGHVVYPYECSGVVHAGAVPQYGSEHSKWIDLYGDSYNALD